MKAPAGKFLSAFQLTSLTGLQLFQLLRYASFILTGIGFAKLHVAPGDIGRFETLLMVSGMLSFFWVSGFINSMLSAYPKQDEGGKKALLFNVFMALIIFSMLAGFVLYLFSENLLHFLNKTGDSNLIKLTVLYLLFNNPSFIIEYTFFLNEKRKALVYYGIATAAITISTVLLPITMGYGIEYAMMALVAVAISKLLFALLLLKGYAGFNFNYKAFVNCLWLALPLMLSIFVSGSAEYIDGLIVKAYFNDSAFAVYRYGAKELPILLIIANTFSTAMIPAIAANLEEGLSELKRKSAQMMHYFFPLTMVLMLASPFLFKYVFNENFILSGLIFNFYLLLVIPRVLFPQTILMGVQKNQFLLLSAILEITLNISLSIYLGNPERLGLSGIALGTFVAFCFDKLFLIILTYSTLGIPPWRYIAFIPWLIYSLLTLIAFGAGYWILSHY